MNTPDTEWEKEFERIVDGIDKDECEYKYGWWETSTGAKSGAITKAKLLQFIQTLLSSRDTYWKEKIEAIKKLYEDQCVEEIGFVVKGDKVWEALDNLK